MHPHRLAQWAPPAGPPLPLAAGALCWETHLPVHSLCEHHLLPFHGVAHVAYTPGAAGPLPRALLADLVAVYSNRLQVTPRAHVGFCDAKVANREIRVWHFAIENGY
jgi:hypothetical protein